MGGFIDKNNNRVVRSEFLTTKGYIRKMSWTDLAAASNTSVHAAITQPASGTTVVTTAITNPAVPRTLRIKGNQSSCTGNVVIAGTDYRDAALTETIAANGTSAVDGVKAFKTVTSITIPTRGAASDTISVGVGVVIGLDRKLSEDGVLLATVDGVYETTRPTVVYSSTNISGNTISFNTAPDASRDYVVYFITGEIY